MTAFERVCYLAVCLLPPEASLEQVERAVLDASTLEARGRIASMLTCKRRERPLSPAEERRLQSSFEGCRTVAAHYGAEVSIVGDALEVYTARGNVAIEWRV